MSRVGRKPGTQKTGGRQKGSPNKVTKDIKELARQYVPGAIKKLAELAGLVDGVMGAQSEQAKVAAIKELLDRGFGKPAQHVDVTGSHTVTHSSESVSASLEWLEGLFGARQASSAAKPLPH